MCHQSVGLIQRALERVGIASVSVSTLPEITRKVNPPRALVVPFPMGYPLGSPRDAALQTRVILSALALLVESSGPILRELIL